MTWRRYALALPILLMTVPPAHGTVETWWHDGFSVGWGPFKVQLTRPAKQQAAALLIDRTPVEKGDTIAGYSVTSGFGPRPRPCVGCSSNHGGVDVATPTGTPLYAPAAISVQCQNTGKGGLVADIWVGSENYKAVHLATCEAGTYQPGQVFATTGNSGTATTGPHLDWRQKVNGEWVKPTKGMLQAVLSGVPLQGQAQAEIDKPQAIALIKQFEGFHPTPYWDYAQWSWGYGTKAPGQHGQINEATAEQDLVAYLDTHCLPLVQPLPVTAQQSSALLSLCYNVGPAQFQSSTLYALTQAGDYESAAWEFDRWVHAKGKRIQGLENRRAEEKQLFLQGQS